MGFRDRLAKTGDMAWIRGALEAVPAPASPATEQWEISLAAFLRLRTDLPELALKPLGLLDRYGALGFGPETVGFDGEDVPWDRVVRLGVHDLASVVTDSAMERESDHIRGLLPPVPGRKWVVDQAMGVLGAAAGPLLSGRTIGVVSEIVYRTRLGREKTLQAGLFAVLVLAARRAVQESLVATARAHGVTVSPDGARGSEIAAPPRTPTAELPGPPGPPSSSDDAVAG